MTEPYDFDSFARGVMRVCKTMRDIEKENKGKTCKICKHEFGECDMDSCNCLCVYPKTKRKTKEANSQ